MKITLEHEVTLNNVQNLRSMLTTIAMKDLSHKKHEHKDMSYAITVVISSYWNKPQ